MPGSLAVEGLSKGKVMGIYDTFAGLFTVSSFPMTNLHQRKSTFAGTNALPSLLFLLVVP